MSKEFIEAKHNSNSIASAQEQEKQLSYILTSKLQAKIPTAEYFTQWAERKYQTNDYFLNWVKLIFKASNFLLFFKYLRYPLPSTKIIRNRIEPQIQRVFNAEDADFKYSVNGVEFQDFAKDLNIKKFNKEVFEKILYNHNSLLVSDLDAEVSNKPKRYFLSIDRVVSILEKDDKVWKIAFKGSAIVEGARVEGIIYIDDKVFAIYNTKLELIDSKPHDLGSTPVDFISDKRFDNDFVIRESLYTYIREEIEEFNFLKTLQKMTEANGTIPVVSKIQVDEDTEDKKGDEGEPNSDRVMASQRAELSNQNASVGTGDFEPGVIHEIPFEQLKDSEGRVNMDIVKNFLNFHYMPTEALEFLNKRIVELEISIVSTVVGDFLESNESSKNEQQIEKSVSILENTLRSFAETLNVIRKSSDTDMLSLKYGKDQVKEVFIHYGTDFFLESQTKLFNDLEKAPNTLERKNIIVRINQNRYKNNMDQLSRNKLLYDLIPYVSDKDFENAIKLQVVSDLNKEYQLRFNYWIGQFEAIYGDIITFAIGLELNKAESLKIINNLIIQLIEQNGNSNSSTNS